MSAASLSTYVSARAGDPAMDMLIRTTEAVRADASFFAREDDTAACVFLTEETPEALAPEAFAQVMARIEDEQTRDHLAAQRVRGDALRAEIARLPSPTREAALDALDHGRWRFAGLGIRRLRLAVDSEAHVELMRIEPGRGVAPHAHGGDEVTLVLTGAYFDGFEHYGPGDISLAQGEFRHAPRADPGEVCYVLAVSYGPPKLRGIYGLLERLSRR